MVRIGIGILAGVSVWLGSMMAAEAQGSIQPIGPQYIAAGDTTTTYTANITLAYPAKYRVYLWVYRNGSTQCFHSSESHFANPGITNPTFNKAVALNAGNNAGDVFKFSATLLFGNIYYPGPDWYVTSSGTAPSGEETLPTTLKNGTGTRLDAAFAAVERDRRREEDQV